MYLKYKIFIASSIKLDRAVVKQFRFFLSKDPFDALQNLKLRS